MYVKSCSTLGILSILLQTQHNTSISKMEVNCTQGNEDNAFSTVYEQSSVNTVHVLQHACVETKEPKRPHTTFTPNIPSLVGIAPYSLQPTGDTRDLTHKRSKEECQIGFQCCHATPGIDSRLSTVLHMDPHRSPESPLNHIPKLSARRCFNSAWLAKQPNLTVQGALIGLPQESRAEQCSEGKDQSGHTVCHVSIMEQSQHDESNCLANKLCCNHHQTESHKGHSTVSKASSPVERRGEQNGAEESERKYVHKIAEHEHGCVVQAVTNLTTHRAA
eukprot:scpid83222/ scgid35264/ 